MTNNIQRQTTAASIDADMLNELFENQKKLDDMFNSVFDDDAFLASLQSSESAESEYTRKARHSPQSRKNVSLTDEDDFFMQKNRHISHFMMPLLIEIIAIYYSIMYFN